MSQEYLESLNALIPLHRQVMGVHPALENHYPIAIAKDEQFLIYDFDPVYSSYQFIKQAPTPMPIPTGVRAAFQLPDYDGRIACVVTPEIFDSQEGYVTILHEFVHCYQYETCEQHLKGQLDVARDAQERGDFMWEINHPFPYTAENFTDGYQQFLGAIDKGDPVVIQTVRNTLRRYLGRHDFEYMVWQEWKEGFARWIENRLRVHFQLALNQGGLRAPFSRVSFYAGGAAFIEHLFAQDPAVVLDLEILFSRINQLT